jgi:phosphate transport system substrate-binding protein
MIQVKKIINLFVLSAIFLASCNYNPKAGMNEETTTRGNIKIAVDESYTLLVEAELDVFQSIYENAKITPVYKPEYDAFNDLLNDSVRLIIASRKLTNEETAYFESRKIFPKTVTIAYDGIAIILNKSNRDSLLKYTDIKGIFEGSINNWKQIDSKNNAGQIKVVFDNVKSSTVRYVVEKFKIQGNLPRYCYAVQKNDEVINYVEKHPNAMGIIGVSWISDKHDSISRGFLKRIAVAAISSEDNPEGNDYFRPYQGFIADKSYPFIREVYVINRESFSGLGSGFVQWIASDQGQRVVLKMGLVPATMPIRLIKTKKSF